MPAPAAASTRERRIDASGSWGKKQSLTCPNQPTAMGRMMWLVACRLAFSNWSHSALLLGKRSLSMGISRRFDQRACSGL